MGGRSGERRRLPRGGKSEGDGTGEKWEGRSESRMEKRWERAQEETGGRGGFTREEGAGGREEGRVGAGPYCAALEPMDKISMN